jgi:hypothetical protein
MTLFCIRKFEALKVFVHQHHDVSQHTVVVYWGGVSRNYGHSISKLLVGERKMLHTGDPNSCPSIHPYLKHDSIVHAQQIDEILNGQGRDGRWSLGRSLDLSYTGKLNTTQC